MGGGVNGHITNGKQRRTLRVWFFGGSSFFFFLFHFNYSESLNFVVKCFTIIIIIFSKQYFGFNLCLSCNYISS